MTALKQDDVAQDDMGGGVAVMATAQPVVLIALGKLKAGGANVRGKGTKADDAQLAADIAAHGVLQNLVVYPSGGGFEVAAGGRRLRALAMLQKSGQIDADYLVPCRVIAADQGGEVSLAENYQRVAMNPADEMAAFKTVIEAGGSPAEVAVRFGVTETFVRQRLRLAALAPAVITALRSGKIGLDQAQAFASVDDPARQAIVLKAAGRDEWSFRPDNIRRQMRQAGITATDFRARYIGRDAYLAAGGAVESDLFTPDEAELWTSMPLIARLVEDQLKAEAAAIRERLGVGEVRLFDGYRPRTEDLADLTRLDGVRFDPADETALPEPRDKLVLWATLDHDGAVSLLPQLYLPAADYVAPEPEDAAPAAPETDACESVAPESGTPNWSARLIDELAMQRRDLLRAALIGQDDLVADYLVFCLIDADCQSPYSHGGGTTLRGAAEKPLIKYDDGQPWGMAAWDGFVDSLNQDWRAGEDLVTRFSAFHALPEAARADWQLFAVLNSLEASTTVRVPNQPDRRRALHDGLAQLIGLDVADSWRPTAVNYFDRLSGAAIKAAIAEMTGADDVTPYVKGKKKAELAGTAEEMAAGSYSGFGGRDAEAKRTRARRWVPEPMRFRQLLPVPQADAA